ncbi:DUF4179 domain-containing protein [Brevibacillus sp. HB1.1]|uniref:DUF4179 domain-containing protein n=1 Tax=Brevibacillus sp. HB1.1 TaxID=2738808 RepID=UPI0015757F08|nr:DUF4179 domain-containing protein [Brevibacillus sp. HB1.1]NTU33492.1 DUF4179 domain-containing protein [Brevibacillus sp. HB1.1]
MTCLDKFMLNAYLEDKLSLRVKQEIQRHLDTCGSCQSKFEQYLDELDTSDDAADDVWQTEATIQNVMDKLPAYPMNVLKLKPIQKQPVQMNWKKRSVDVMKKTTIAVAGLAMVVTFGTAVSPTFANYMNGIYASINPSEITVTKGPYNAKQVVNLFDKKQTDIGVKKAAENGFVQPLDMKVTDQGLTMEINAVVADPLRIMVLGSVKDSSGKKIPSFWKDQFTFISSDNVNEFREVRLKDKNGKVITRLDDKTRETVPWLPLPNGENFAYGGSMDAYFDEANPIPDELILEMRVKRLTDTKGTWSLDIPIDMRPGKAAMKTVAVNKQLDTPTGTTVELKKARFTSTGTELEFSTSKPDEKLAGIRYELLDETGTVMGKWDDLTSPDDMDHNLVLIGQSSGAGLDFETKKPDTSWFHTYMPLDPAKNLTLKLDAVYTVEKSTFQAKLPLAEMEKKPITVKSDGNEFAFKSVKKETDDEGNLSYLIEVEGKLANDMLGIPDYWDVSTDKDKGDDVERGVFTFDQKVKEGSTLKFTGELKVWSESPNVKEMTVSFDSMSKEHKVNWEVPIIKEKK